MKERFDTKGKYFTNVVTKLPLRTTIQTASQTIEGTVYLHPGNRLIDELNDSPGFIAVTSACISNGEGTLEAEFLALNVEQIVWIVPLEANAGGNQDGS